MTSKWQAKRPGGIVPTRTPQATCTTVSLLFSLPGSLQASLEHLDISMLEFEYISWVRISQLDKVQSTKDVRRKYVDSRVTHVHAMVILIHCHWQRTFLKEERAYSRCWGIEQAIQRSEIKTTNATNAYQTGVVGA